MNSYIVPSNIPQPPPDLASLKTLLFEVRLSDGEPLFESAADLAASVAGLGGKRYQKKKTVEALMSQVTRGARPIPDRLLDSILTVLTKRYADGRKAIFNSGPSLADIRGAASRHNGAVQQGGRLVPDDQFRQEMEEFSTHAVFLMDSIFDGADLAAPWDEVLELYVALLARRPSDDAKYEFYTFQSSTAYRVWETLHVYARRFYARNPVEGAPATLAEEILAKANRRLHQNAALTVYVVHRQGLPPGIPSQVAFAPKTGPVVYTYFQRNLYETAPRDADRWSLEFQNLYSVKDQFTEVTWADYARPQKLYTLV